MNASQIVDLIDHMLTEPFTVQQLQKRSGLYIQTVRAIVKEMQGRRLIYVAGWERRNEGRIKLPIYKLGDGDDQSKPGRISAAEATRRYKQKVRFQAQFGGYGTFYDICRPVAVSREVD